MKIFLDPMRFCVCMLICTPLCAFGFEAAVTHSFDLGDAGYGTAGGATADVNYFLEGSVIGVRDASGSLTGTINTPGSVGVFGVAFDGENLYCSDEGGNTIYRHLGGGNWTSGLGISSSGGRDLAVSDDYFFLMNGDGSAIDIYSKTNGLSKGSLDISGIMGEGFGLTYIPQTNSLVATDGDENLYWLDLAESQTGNITIPNWTSTAASGLGGDQFLGAGWNYESGKLVLNDSEEIGKYAELYTTNGTPYSWLIDHSLSNDTTDPDLDGFLTWQEYICDTIPTDSNSFLSVSIAGTELSFDSSTNCLYGIDSKGSMASNTWNTLTNNLPGSGSAITLTATNPAPCFFRLNAERR